MALFIRSMSKTRLTSSWTGSDISTGPSKSDLDRFGQFRLAVLGRQLLHLLAVRAHVNVQGEELAGHLGPGGQELGGQELVGQEARR